MANDLARVWCFRHVVVSVDFRVSGFRVSGKTAHHLKWILPAFCRAMKLLMHMPFIRLFNKFDSLDGSRLESAYRPGKERMNMERFTISLSAELAREFDELIRARGYQNRSEAMRDILRQHIEEQRLRVQKAPQCVANVSYVYSHHERELADRVIDLQHHFHDLAIATMHAHLDHDQCMESLFLKGHTDRVRACADSLIAERGVRHGAINLVPVDLHTHRHAHANETDEGAHDHEIPHHHARPKS